MTYFEVSKDILGGYSLRQPDIGEAITGKVNGNPKAIQIINDASVSHDGDIKMGSDGAIVFDKSRWFNPRKAVVYFNSKEAQNLKWDEAWAEQYGGEGVFQDVLTGVFRRALVQAGLRKQGQRSLLERLEAAATFGASETYSK